MKLISILCLFLSLAVPTAAAPKQTNAKNCIPEASPDEGGTVFGHTRVRIICKGKAKDFGGASGNNTIVDCFDKTETTANDIRVEDCKNITVTIKYKMGNAMNNTEVPIMELKSASFGRGNFNPEKPAKNVGIEPSDNIEQFTDINNLNFPEVAKPKKGAKYIQKQFSVHKYEAIVNQCAEDGSNQFFMKMRLIPTKAFPVKYYTATCGTNDKIEFSIIAAEPSMAPSATAKTSAPSAPPAAESTPAPQEPIKVTSAPSPAPSSGKGKGKGPKSPGKSKVRKTIRGY